MKKIKEFFSDGKKKGIVYASISLLVLAIAIVGLTYAYFQNQYGDNSSADIGVTTYTTDSFVFTVGQEIGITASQKTFAEGKGSISASTFAAAELQANNKTNEATDYYTLGIEVKDNSFVYTNSKKPQLVLSVINEKGEEIKEVSGLDYKTVTDGNGEEISGFDITTLSNSYIIFSNRMMSTTSKTTEKWNVKVTFVNYNEDQSVNSSKSFTAILTIKKSNGVEENVEITDVCNSGENFSSCIISRHGIDKNLYHHDGTLDNGIDDDSYRYAGNGTTSCTYLGLNVVSISSSSYNGFANSSEAGCKDVHKIAISDLTYGGVTFKENYSQKDTISWNKERNACLTSKGYHVYSGYDLLDESLCFGSAYYSDSDKKAYIGEFVELGSGTWDSTNSKCSFHSQYLYGAATEDACKTIYALKSYTYKYIDSSFYEFNNVEDTAIWDDDKYICIASTSGDTISNVLKSDCFGKVIYNTNYTSSNFLKNNVEDVGPGVWKDTRVKNYVCFGSDSEDCPEDNMYQIIGVFDDKVKLIKATPATKDMLGTNGAYSSSSDYNNSSYYYYGLSSNVWSKSELNLINLNTNFLNYLGTNWTSKIFDATWKVGGNSSYYIAHGIPSVVYNHEILGPASGNAGGEPIEYTPQIAASKGSSSKIGLMYISDYGFASDPSHWNTILSEFNENSPYTMDDWIYGDYYNLSITRENNSASVFYVHGGDSRENGYIDWYPYNYSHSIRPVFYLNSNVKYVSGNGRYNKPFRI